jgi:iron complex outermembrane recepter protein
MTVPFRARRLATPPLALSLLSTAFALPAQAQDHEAVDELIVTGVPRDSLAGDLAQSVSIVSGDELDRIRSSNLGETLANQLGVNSSYFGAGASRPIIRGLAGARVQMLEDGIDTMDAATLSDDHAVTVEPLAADQIEIFRGPTTLLYGSGAVGGVVNTVTTRIPGVAPEDGFEGAFELRGDSVAGARGAAVRLDGGAERFAWHFDAGRRDSDDYDIPGFAHADADPADAGPEEAFGFVPNSAAESDSAAFGASWLGDGGFLGLGINTFDSLYGIPGHEHEHEEGEEPVEPEPEEAAVRIDLKQRRVDLRGGWDELSGAIEGVNVRLGINDYEHVELEGDAVGTLFTNDARELRVELLHRTAGRWSGAFGVQLGDREFAAVGEEAFVPPVDTSTTGLFVVEQVELDPWELSLGARIESQEHTPSNGLPVFDENATSFSFGSIRRFGDGYAFVATLALSDRLPVAEELYSDGPHLATGAVQIGDASLSEETARHVDIGIRGELDELEWSVTAFNTQYDDFIYLADTGTEDPVDELPIFAYTQADADFTGLEAEVFVPLLSGGANEVDLRLFADYVRGELANGESLPRLPPLRYGARLEYHNERLLVGVEGTRYDDQDDVAPFEEETPGYLLMNADVRWQLVGVTGMELELFLNASNLGDEEARKHTSFVKDVAPLPGRNYALGIRSRF